MDLSGPRRLSDFVGLLHRAPSLEDLDRLRAEGMRAILDTREAGSDLTPLDQDALKAALTARDLTYARLILPREDPDPALLDRFGEVLKSLPKPMVIVSASGDPAGLFALAHIAIAQGMPGEMMLETARTLGVDYGSVERHQRIAAYVDEREQQPKELRSLERAARAGSPIANPLHRRAVVMHTEVKAIAHPLRSSLNELPVQIAAGVSVVGLLGALLVDRRLAVLSLIGAGYLAQRAWSLISRPATVAENAVVPQSEVDHLRRELEHLKTA